MKIKQLSMAGLLGCAAITSAHASVTIYGIVDVPIEYITNLASAPATVNPDTGIVTNYPGGSRAGIASAGGLSGSQFGFRGVEELGSGLKALFVLENGFNPDTGTFQQAGRLFGRQGFVGIESDQLGKFTLGRQYSALFDIMYHASPMKYSSTYEPVFLQLGPNARADNTIKYTGNFGKFTTEAHYSFGVGVAKLALTPLANGGAGETAGHSRDNTAFGVGLMYRSDGLTVSMAYDQWNAAVTTGQPGAAKKLGISSSYAFGPTKIMAGYRWGSGKSHDNVMLLRDDYFWAGIQHRLNPTLEVSLGLYYENVKTLRVRSTAPLTQLPEIWQVSFNTVYSLSKRTDLYLTTAYSKNAGLNMDTSANGYAGGFFVAQGHSSQLGTAIGIRHRF